MRDFGKFSLILILGILLGIGLVRCFDAPKWIEWEGKIGPEQIFDVLIAVGVVLFLGNALQKAFEVRKFENSLISDAFKDCLQLIREMKGEFDGAYRSTLPRKDFVEKFVSTHRKFKNRLSDIVDLSDLLSHREAKLCEELKMKSTLYKAVVTNGSPADPFDSIDNSKHEAKYNELRRSLWDAMIRFGKKY